MSSAVLSIAFVLVALTSLANGPVSEVAKYIENEDVKAAPSMPSLHDLGLPELQAELAKSDPDEKDFWSLIRSRMLAMEIYRRCSLEKAMAYSFQAESAEDVATSAMNICGMERDDFVRWSHVSVSNQGRPDARKEAEGFVAQSEEWLTRHLTTLVMEVRLVQPEKTKR